MPKPSFPPVSVFGLVIGDAVAIAIVSFALNVSMAKLFAKKHKYEIKANQVNFKYITISMPKNNFGKSCSINTKNLFIQYSYEYTRW